MHKFMINLVVFTIIGGLVGWTIGKLVAGTAMAYNRYRLRRSMKRTNKAIRAEIAEFAKWN